MSRPTLDSLPLDVSYSILSHLCQGPHSIAHPFLALSAVSRNLNCLIEGYTAHIIATRLTQWSKSKSGAVPNRRYTNRKQLLRHVWKHCEFCNQISSRRAILAYDLVCCKVCDKREWEEKITMTEACKKYHLKQQDLFDGKIRHGEYYGVSGLTTLFLEYEVRELATRIHAGVDSDLAVYLALRTSQSAERKAGREKRLEAKKAHLGRVLIANGLTNPTFMITLAPLLSAGGNKRPAMTALEIVRMKLLLQRLEEVSCKEYHFQANYSRSYSGVSSWVWDRARSRNAMIRTLLFLQNPNFQPRSRSVYDQRDKALFELFCTEFSLLPSNQKKALKGNHESGEKRDAEAEGDHKICLHFYEYHRRMWASVPDLRHVLWIQNQSIIASPGRRNPWEVIITKQSEPPWSWARYPILVKDAVVEDPEPIITAAAAPDPKKAAEKEKELRRVNKWNAGAEKEMARITALINERGLDKDLWCRPGYPHKEDGVEVGDALQVLRESK